MAIPITELNLDGAVGYHYDQFPPASIDHKRLMEPVFKAGNALARYDQMLKNLHNSEILLAPLRNQEAIISSRMEGTVSTMDEILRYEADNAAGTENSSNARTEVVETIMYQRTLKAAQQELESGKPISEFLIRSMHGKLLSFGRGAEKSPGQFKTEQNYVVDKTKRNVLFVPVSVEKLTDGMEALLHYMDSGNEQILIRTGISHVEFEALHPFKDGNGRLGRMLITLMLWKAQVISAPYFYISGYMEEHKDAYIDSMKAVSANNSWTEWCEFFLAAVESQAIRNLEIAESINALYEEMRHHFQEILGTRWHAMALDYVFTNPYFRNNNFTGNSGIPEQTANRFSKILLERGFLKTLEQASGRRAAMYAFVPLTTLLRVN